MKKQVEMKLPDTDGIIPYHHVLVAGLMAHGYKPVDEQPLPYATVMHKHGHEMFVVRFNGTLRRGYYPSTILHTTGGKSAGVPSFGRRGAFVTGYSRSVAKFYVDLFKIGLDHLRTLPADALRHYHFHITSHVV